MSDITLRNMTKQYDNSTVVKDINITIKNGEFVVLLGPSGCGKSTILRMAAGLEEISEGEIYINGELANDIPPKDRGITMVFQDYMLYPHMNIYDNIAFGLRLNQVPQEDIKYKVKEIAKILEIEDLLTRFPSELSGGQCQRVAIGRAVVCEPEILLMDEPLSNLDANLKVQMRSELSKLHEMLEMTILYVTHNQAEAMSLADRIIVLNEGVIQQVGEPIDLYNDPNNIFVASFIGSPTMNFLTGKIVRIKNQFLFIVDDDFIVDLSKMKSELSEKLKAYIGQKIILGIRPKNIIVSKSIDNLVRGIEFIKAEVNMVEFIGPKINLHLRVGKQKITVRVDNYRSIEVGEQIEILFNPNKLHFFESETKKVIK